MLGMQGLIAHGDGKMGLIGNGLKGLVAPLLTLQSQRLQGIPSGDVHSITLDLERVLVDATALKG